MFKAAFFFIWLLFRIIRNKEKVFLSLDCHKAVMSPPSNFHLMSVSLPASILSFQQIDQFANRSASDHTLEHFQFVRTFLQKYCRLALLGVAPKESRLKSVKLAKGLGLSSEKESLASVVIEALEGRTINVKFPCNGDWLYARMDFTTSYPQVTQLRSEVIEFFCDKKDLGALYEAVRFSTKLSFEAWVKEAEDGYASYFQRPADKRKYKTFSAWVNAQIIALA